MIPPLCVHRLSAEGLSAWALAYAACDIILGVLFIAHPVVSAVVIPWVMGIFVIAYGIFEVVAAVRFHREIPGWGWVLFAGIVSLFCGIAFIVHFDIHTSPRSFNPEGIL